MIRRTRTRLPVTAVLTLLAGSTLIVGTESTSGRRTRHTKANQARRGKLSGETGRFMGVQNVQCERARERQAGRVGSLFFRRDRTREVEFVVDPGGRLELVEAKGAELPDSGDTVDPAFMRGSVGAAHVLGGAVIARTPNGFPFDNGFRAVSVPELALL